MPHFDTFGDSRFSGGGVSLLMDDAPNRIRTIRKGKGLSLKALAERTGASISQVSRLEKGQRDLTLSWMEKLARGLECSPTDLLPLTMIEPALAALPATLEEEEAFRRANAAGVDTQPWPVPLRGESFWYCPNGCAYFGKKFLDDFNIDPRQCEVVEVWNASMSPTLPNGSVCLVYKRLHHRLNHEIFAIERKGELLIRRLREKRNRWYIQAETPAEPTLLWDDDVQMIGQVIWACRMVVASQVLTELSVTA